MTDLRNALKRASETGGNETLDHGAVSQKVQRVVRRRRAMYAAGTALFVLVVGFSAFQIAEGNWFADRAEGDSVTTAPDEPRWVVQAKPKNPVVGDEVSFTLKNVGDSTIHMGPTYFLSGPDPDLDGESGFMREIWISPNEVGPVGPQIPPAVFEEPGTYSLTLNMRLDGRTESYIFEFTVAPAREQEFEPIVVDAPTSGEAVSSPVTVSGTADVYEGTVSIRILDANGNVINETFTTATCGSGCRGDFSQDVTFEIDTQQSGTIEVYSESAETGDPMHLVEIPVTLVPSDPAPEETPDESELPAITVESHQDGDRMTAPSTVVSGTANTFEANVRIRLLDANGNALVDTFTTATCGTGCRGDYSKRIKFEVDQEQQGTLQVFESSAEDGSDINMVEISVILTPN